MPTCSDAALQRLAAASPKRSPWGWLGVNGFCLAATLVTFVDIWIATEDLSERPTAAALYLAWNFGTTLVWCSEVGLSIANHIVGETNASLEWATKIEFLLAIYLTLDSLHLLWKWKIKKQKLEEELIDVCINLLSFSYASYNSYRALQSRKEGSKSTQQTETATESTRLLA